MALVTALVAAHEMILLMNEAVHLEGAPDLTMARAVRRSRNLRQRDVAAAAGLDTAVVSRVENGRERPTENVRRRIADALGLAPAEVTKAP